MGTSSSFGEVARKLNQAAKNIEADMPKTILRAAEAAKGEIDGEIRRRVPDLEMSGLVRKIKKGKNAGKLKSGKVGTKIGRGKVLGGGVYQSSVRAVGPVHWLEAGTRPHAVGVGRLTAGGQVRLTKKGQFRKGQRARMNFPGGEDGWRVGPFQHPGMPAGHTWSKGVRRATPKATQQMAQHVPRAALRPFIG